MNDWSAGTRLGPYEILAAIGKGGMGEVWKARDTRLNRDVAIKRLKSDHTARFEQETRAIAALNHPHICQIYDVGPAYIVMEYVDGKPLQGPLPVEEVLRLASQIAEALEEAHAKGILHRDLKPANILLTAKGSVKLLDFGLAKLMRTDSSGATETIEGTVMGTAEYMSPEQAQGRALDQRSDIFSFGAVLYELISGRRAFSGQSMAEVLSAVLRDDPAPLQTSGPLSGVVNRSMAKRAADRYASVTELRAALAVAAKAAPEPDKPSIAVLPFENLSADADNEFFSDGLTDEIITDLSQLRTLRVISRGSSMQMKAAGEDLSAVAYRLQVRYVLTGSVRRSGNAIRVTAQLVDPRRDELLWAEKCSGTLEDIFAIQERISRRIVEGLKIQLSPSEDRRLAERPIDNLQALECYHRACRAMYTFTKSGLDQALDLIAQALDFVGENELLIAAQGLAYWQYGNAVIRYDPGDIERAEACAARVFALNPNSAAGFGLLGVVRQGQGRPVEAVRNFRRALEIDPRNELALDELGRVYNMVGRHEGREMYERVLAVDPLSPIFRAGLEITELLSGRNYIVQREASQVLRAVPGFAICRHDLALSLIHEGRNEEALAALAAAPEERVPTIGGRLNLFLRLGLEGRRAEAAVCVEDDLLRGAREVEFWAWWVSECYAFIGADELAVDWLECAFAKGFQAYPYLAEHSSIYRRLHSNSRFQELMGRIKTSWDAIQFV